jgi:hypothetical protein
VNLVPSINAGISPPDHQKMTRQNSASRNSAQRVIGKTTRRDREAWRVVSNAGKIKTIVTSTSTASVMDQAMLIYDRALRRLANR